MAKQFFLLIALMAGASVVWAQSTERILAADSLVREGVKLFQMEEADQHSMLKMSTTFSMEGIVAHFTYPITDGRRTVFVNERNKVRFSFTYLDGDVLDNAEVVGTERPLTSQEKTLLKIVRKTEKLVAKDTVFFKPTASIKLRPILSINANNVTVLLISHSIFKHIVPFGNDYRLTYSSKGKLLDRQRIHRNFIPVEANPMVEAGKQILSGAHSHAGDTQEYITASDICVLLLHQPFLAWDTHIVFADHFVSVFHIPSRRLQIFSGKEWQQRME